jgi:glutaminyl-peptide cyclotransferase
MFRAQVAFLALLVVTAPAAEFSGDSAFEFARRAVAFGPRPSGSDAIKGLQGYILERLKQCQCEVTEDNFIARTPRGEIAMKNIITRFSAKSASNGTARAIAVTGHYDTKYFPGRKFVGASDGGSSTGLLLELARVLTGEAHANDVYVVFFDGEEAAGEWSDADKLYGSRHLVSKWRADGTLSRIRAVINVDMIGDKDLNLKKETNSSRGLVEIIWGVAADLGYSSNFTQDEITIDDDHMPFLQAGVGAVDLIDFDYEPWHEDSDTLDKLSARSLEAVGRVVHEVVRRIDTR